MDLRKYLSRLHPFTKRDCQDPEDPIQSVWLRPDFSFATNGHVCFVDRESPDVVAFGGYEKRGQQFECIKGLDKQPDMTKIVNLLEPAKMAVVGVFQMQFIEKYLAPIADAIGPGSVATIHFNCDELKKASVEFGNDEITECPDVRSPDRAAIFVQGPIQKRNVRNRSTRLEMSMVDETIFISYPFALNISYLVQSVRALGFSSKNFVVLKQEFGQEFSPFEISKWTKTAYIMPVRV
jgi:hypothetical protein